VDFDVAVQHLDDRVVVRVEGDLDLASADAFEDAMSTVTFPVPCRDRSGLVHVSRLGRHARHRGDRAKRSSSVNRLRPRPSVLRVLEITAVDMMVSVHASLDDVL
jgi:hypothetical protein